MNGGGGGNSSDPEAKALCASARENDPLLGTLHNEQLRWSAVSCAAFACLSGLLLGYDIGVSAGSLQPIAETFGLLDRKKELYIGILNLFALPGCLVTGWLCDYFGRRKVICLAACIFLVGNSLMTFATSFAMLLIGRAIAGVAIGITLVAEPLFTSETAPARLRGMLSTNVEVSFNVGIVIGFVSSGLCSALPTETSWRVMIGCSLWAPVVSLLGMLYIVPESPRWLAMQGRLEEADKALQYLLGPLEASFVATKLRKIARDNRAPSISWATMIFDPPTNRSVLIGVGVAFFSQATGIETIQYYNTEILREAHMSTDGMSAFAITWGLFKLAAILVSGCVVDTVGRRPLLLLSSIGMSLSMQMLGLSFYYHTSFEGKVAPMITFVLLFSLGFGPIVYTLNAEIYPTACRAKGVVLGMAAGRVTSTLVSISFLSIKDGIGLVATFGLYASMGAIAAVFIFFIVPETSGTNLEDLSDSSSDKDS